MLDFRTEFERIFEEHNISYDVKGIITSDKKIYSLGTDSKVLSTVFELLVESAPKSRFYFYVKRVKLRM